MLCLQMTRKEIYRLIDTYLEGKIDSRLFPDLPFFRIGYNRTEIRVVLHSESVGEVI